MLHGEALRAELRRICSLAYVMPPPPVPPEPREPPSSRYGASDNQLLQRRISLVRAAQKRKEVLIGKKAAALANRPEGTLYREEVCRALGRSSTWFDRRIRLAALQPIKQDGFAWFLATDLQRAGILPQVG